MAQGKPCEIKQNKDTNVFFLQFLTISLIMLGSFNSGHLADPFFDGFPTFFQVKIQGNS